MIVIDVSILANALGDDANDGKAARRRLADAAELAGPDLIDVETVAVLRKRWLAGSLTERRFSSAIEDLEQLDLSRYPTLGLMRRAFELRSNVTVYDAAYVALAEGLDCPLVTADIRLANAAGVSCQVEVLRP